MSRVFQSGDFIILLLEKKKHILTLEEMIYMICIVFEVIKMCLVG